LILSFVAGLSIGLLLGGILMLRFLWRAIKNVTAIGASLIEESSKQNQARQQAEAFAQMFQEQDPH